MTATSDLRLPRIQQQCNQLRLPAIAGQCGPLAATAERERQPYLGYLEVLLAAEVDADLIIYEDNYGGDMAATVIRGTWATLQNTDRIPRDRLCPRLQGVTAKRNKVLRAEPIAQAMRQDRVRTAVYLSEMEAEWLSYTLGDPNSPGRIDTSVYLGWGLLPLPSPGESPVADTGILASTNLLAWRRG